MYGFIEASHKARFEQFCDSMMVGAVRGKKIDFKKRVYIFQCKPQNRDSQSWALLQIHSSDYKVTTDVGGVFNLYQRTLCLYENVLKNNDAHHQVDQVTVKAVAQIKGNRKESIATH